MLLIQTFDDFILNSKMNFSAGYLFTMLLKAKFRKIFLTAIVVTIVGLAFTLVVVPAPDLSQEVRENLDVLIHMFVVNVSGLQDSFVLCT